MKRSFTFICALATVCRLTSAAYADVIAESPGEVILSSIGGGFPAALVIVVVAATAVLLRKFWKRK